MSEWKECRLGDVCNRLSSGKNIKAELISKSGAYPVYGGNGLRGYTATPNFFGECVIIGRQGAMCGNVRYFSGEAYMTEHAVVLQANDNTSTRFLSYLLPLMNLGRLSGQSAQPGLAVGTIANQIVKLPTLSEQKKIAGILSSLDEKIETNLKINVRLEELAQAIFKSWFIDFEPFGGKMPEDWETCNLGDIVNIRYGKDHKNLADGIFPIYGSGGIMRYSEKYLYDKDSVLIPRKGSLNNIYYIDDPFWTVDTMFFTEMKKDNLAKYIFFYLKRFDFESMNCGSAIPSMSTSILNALKIILPSDTALIKFEETIQPIFIRFKHLHKESVRLAELRDTLLPKLISGELIRNKL